MAVHRATLCFSSSLGRIEIEASPWGITRVRLGAGGALREVGEPASLVLARTARQELFEYLDGERRGFDVPVDASGTPFQRAVWEALQAIPYGATDSYGSIAARLGRPRAARAVGSACGANPVPILVPCHRAVSGVGGLGGFSAGLGLKRQLLDCERSRVGTETVAVRG